MSEERNRSRWPWVSIFAVCTLSAYIGAYFWLTDYLPMTHNRAMRFDRMSWVPKLFGPLKTVESYLRWELIDWAAYRKEPYQPRALRRDGLN